MFGRRRLDAAILAVTWQLSSCRVAFKKDGHCRSCRSAAGGRSGLCFSSTCRAAWTEPFDQQLSEVIGWCLQLARAAAAAAEQNSVHQTVALVLTGTASTTTWSATATGFRTAAASVTASQHSALPTVAPATMPRAKTTSWSALRLSLCLRPTGRSSQAMPMSDVNFVRMRVPPS